MKSILFDGKEFQPSKIICVGLNYLDHIREMGNNAAPTEPVIFAKPNSAIHVGGGNISFPKDLGLLHHEVELCVLIGKEGSRIPEADAKTFIAGYGTGIDFTLRDVQSKVRGAGFPWELSKGFDNAGAFGAFSPADEIDDPYNLSLSLHVNGKQRQNGNTSDMVFSVEALIHYVSRYMTLQPGDIFMTGTPMGVGPVEDGDSVSAKIEGLSDLSLTVIRK